MVNDKVINIGDIYGDMKCVEIIPWKDSRNPLKNKKPAATPKIMLRITPALPPSRLKELRLQVLIESPPHC